MLLRKRGEAGALHELHRDVVDAVLLPRSEDRDHVRVAQRSHGAGFAHETRHILRAAGELGREELQRDRTAQVLVHGMVHRAHAALPDLA